MHRFRAFFIAGLVFFGLLTVGFHPLPPVQAQVRTNYDKGITGLMLQLRKLGTTASVLHIGAHPDDEDSALIARLARGDGARVGYLSLTRGEGGQNLIGPEQGEALGVIRTEELLQARKIDGGEQYFTRAFDFGFSKSRDEAAAKWGEDVILMDVVKVIREFRPLVIVAQWGGTPADGHGHHQFAGYITPIAFKKAADPKWHPELGPAWETKKLYVNAIFAPAENKNPALKIPTGVYDPVLGRTYYQIAMEGRSQHKSQEQGALEPAGEKFSSVKLIESVVSTDPKTEKTIFDGLDTSYSGFARLLNVKSRDFLQKLQIAEQAAVEANTSFDPFHPEKILPLLAKAEKALAEAYSVEITESEDLKDILRDFSQIKERDFETALFLASGIRIEAISDRETYNFEPSLDDFPDMDKTPTVRVVAHIPPSSGVSFKLCTYPARHMYDWPSNRDVEKDQKDLKLDRSFPLIRVDRDQPWIISRKISNSEYEVFPEALSLEFAFGDSRFGTDIFPEFRFADPVRGEIRRIVEYVPTLSVKIDQKFILASKSIGTNSRRVVVTIDSNSQKEQKGAAKLNVPNGWPVTPTEFPYTLPPGGRATAVFSVTVPENAPPGDYKLSASATAADRVYTREMQMISYPHIQTHRLYRPAETRVQVADVKVADVKVGYVMGSGDLVPQAIERLGISVKLLDEQALTTGDLSGFDVIVVGIRASQVRPDFVANNRRLLDWVSQGGTLIVQYQRPDYVQNRVAPFPATMFTRTTDENARVTILEPKHPAFTFPNVITDADWNGWVQERSLYDFTTFDPQYTPLLESHDEGETPHNGGELYARIGRGHYVYTSYAWFRQLPAGVPGAYRLFANLLSLPKANWEAVPTKPQN